jgi:prefoldin subunit 5
MTNENLLQKTLNITIERLGRQAISYEAEIANLNSQIFILNDKIEELSKTHAEKQAKQNTAK